MIKRDPEIHRNAFTGSHYLVNTETGLAIESWYTLDQAKRALLILNSHANECGKSELYKIESEPARQIE